MPIYEYKCDSCGDIIESLQKTNDPDPDKCSCGGNYKKIMSNGSFILKGSGWYATDYGLKRPKSGPGRDQSKKG